MGVGRGEERTTGWPFATYNACVDYKSPWHNKLLYLQKFCLHGKGKRKGTKRKGEKIELNSQKKEETK